MLADAEQRALRELIRLHLDAGNTAKATQLKEDYRQILLASASVSTSVDQAHGAKRVE